MRRRAIGALCAAVTCTLVIGANGAVGAEGSNDLSGQPPAAIVNLAEAATSTTDSVRMVQDFSTDRPAGYHVTSVYELTSTAVREIDSGNVVGAGTILALPGVTYVRGTARYLRVDVGLPGQMASVDANHWISTKPGDKYYQQATPLAFYNQDTFGLAIPTGQLTVTRPTTIDGTKVVGVSGSPSAGAMRLFVSSGSQTLYVSQSPPHYPVELVVKGTAAGGRTVSVTIRLSQWGAHFSYRAPGDAAPISGASG